MIRLLISLFSAINRQRGERKMSNRIRLIGLDLDGTLLNDKKQLNLIDEYKIEKAMEKGIIVVPVTGRPQKGIPNNIEKLFHSSYIITSNGAVTTDVKLQKNIDGAYLSSKTALHIVELIQRQQEDIKVEIFADGIGYVEKNQLNIIKEFYRGTNLESYFHTSRIPVNNINKLIINRNEDIAEISIMTQSIAIKDRIQKLLARFEDIKITSSVQTDLEINATNAGKGLALLRLAKRLGIHNSEIMACGDSGNDIEMLQSAGIAVAMGNANEEIKKVADFVTLSNEEYGVAYAIDRFILDELVGK